MSTTAERKQWRDENLKMVTDALHEARYQATAIFEAPAGTRGGSIEIWTGPGKVPVIGVQLYPEDMGFELLAALTDEQDMRKVVKVLEWATTPGEGFGRFAGRPTSTDLCEHNVTIADGCGECLRGVQAGLRAQALRPAVHGTDLESA